MNFSNNFEKRAINLPTNIESTQRTQRSNGKQKGKIACDF